MGCKDKKVTGCPTAERGYCDKVNYIVTPKFCNGCKGDWQRIVKQMQAAKDQLHKQLMPDIPTKIVNLSGAIKRSVRRLLKGEPVRVPDDVHAHRWGMCKNCTDLKGNACLHCGCGMNIKTWWASERCPIGKWPEYTKE